MRSGFPPTRSCRRGSATVDPPGRASPEPCAAVPRQFFTYQAGSWTKPRRVVAKVEWHPGELVPRVGVIVTNLSRPAERVVAFYNQRHM